MQRQQATDLQHPFVFAAGATPTPPVPIMDGNHNWSMPGQCLPHQGNRQQFQASDMQFQPAGNPSWMPQPQMVGDHQHQMMIPQPIPIPTNQQQFHPHHYQQQQILMPVEGQAHPTAMASIPMQQQPGPPSNSFGSNSGPSSYGTTTSFNGGRFLDENGLDWNVHHMQPMPGIEAVLKSLGIEADNGPVDIRVVLNIVESVIESNGQLQQQNEYLKQQMETKATVGGNCQNCGFHMQQGYVAGDM